MPRLSLQTKVLLFIATLFLLMILQAVYLVAHEYRLLRDEVNTRATVLSQALAEMSREPLLSLHLTRLEEQLDSMLTQGELDYAQIVSGDYRVLADTRRQYEGWILSGQIADELRLFNYKDSVVARAPIRLESELVGMVELRLSLTAMLDQVRTNSLIATGILLIGIFFALLFAWFLEQQIVVPLRIVAETADRIPSEQEIDRIPNPHRAGVEISAVVAAINAMQMRLNQHTRLETIGKMAASVAHEIRNPLEAMSGAVEILSGAANDDEQSYLKIIREEIANLNAYLTEFLAFSASKDRHVVSIAVVPLVENVLMLLRPLISGTEIDVSTALDTCTIAGHPEEVKRLLVNLLLNAIDAQPDSGGRIGIAAEARHPMVELRIQDHGHGIPQDLIPRVFEPYTTTKEKGSGLGLPFCRTVAERYGGTIAIESAEGIGTTVTVRLPAHD